MYKETQTFLLKWNLSSQKIQGIVSKSVQEPMTTFHEDRCSYTSYGRWYMHICNIETPRPHTFTALHYSYTLSRFSLICVKMCIYTSAERVILLRIMTRSEQWSKAQVGQLKPSYCLSQRTMQTLEEYSQTMTQQFSRARLILSTCISGRLSRNVQPSGNNECHHENL